MLRSLWDKLSDSVRREPFVPLVALLAFLLMVYGTWRVQPHLTFPDETGAIETALKMGDERTPFIDNFRKGGNLHLYLLALSFVPVVVYWLITSQFGDIMSATASVGSSPSWGVPSVLIDAFYDVLFAGRLVSVILGVGTVVVMYYLGRELADRRAGIFASLFLTVSNGYVLTAHYATEDVPMTFFLMLGFLLIIRAYHSSHTNYLLAGAVVTGLATSAKATAGLLVVPLSIVILEQHWSARDAPIEFLQSTWKYPAVTILGYVVTTPSLLVHPYSWSNEISRYLSRNTGDSVAYSWPDPGWLIQLAHIAEGQGIALFVFSFLSFLAVTGLLLNKDLDSGLWLLMTYAVPYFFIITQGNMTQFPRVLPLFPLLAVFAGVVASEISRPDISLRPAGLVILALVLAFSGIHTAVAVSNINESKKHATDWTHENLDESATVDVYSQRVYLPEFPEEATVNRYVIHSTLAREGWQPGLERLDCQRPEYVVLTSDHYFRFFQDPTVFPEVTDRMERLMAEENYEIVKTFGPPIDTEQSASRKFEKSASLKAFPEESNPTIVILHRKADEPAC